MKNLQILLVLCVLFFGCKGSQTQEEGNQKTSTASEDPLNPMEIDSTNLIDGEYMFFLDEAKYAPLINVNDTSNNIAAVDFTRLASLEEKIIADVESAFKIKLDKKDVFAISFSGFYVSGMPRVQALEILSNTSMISSAQNNFTFQNIRARMQAPGPIPQNIRARMQEWQYDSVKRTSSKVLYVRPVLAPGDLNKKIWIVDTGVDANHPDLNVIKDLDYTKSYVDSFPLEDFNGHGTHCAGIAAGKADTITTGVGMNGISPGAPIVSIKVIDNNDEGKWADVLKALKHIELLSNSGDVVNLSIGGLLPGNNNCNFQMGISNQIKSLSQVKNVFVVIAAGNSFDAGNTAISSTKFFPGCFDFPGFDKVFTVGSLGVYFNFSPPGGYSTPTFSTFSNFGIPSIDYVAPGDSVFSTYMGSNYAILSGTSMATAMVSGVIHAKGTDPDGSLKLVGPPGTTNYPIAKF